ncbi:MAG TPA: bifunctional 2-polyprenyl-6-hydroxyphenol methylase/3-demethylubiquinol 3-O-methyltransferase UbiG [Candidatus Azoamicus sp. OHIO1]
MDTFEFKFISENWWDLNGPCKALHSLNNVRLNYIKNKTPITNKNIIDLGCGGGILSEKLTLHNGNVTGIDNSKELILIAKNHSKNKKTQYLNYDIENFSKTNKNKFDIIICMEVIEHIKDPIKLINLCKEILNINGDIFLSSLNKNIKTYLNMIFFGEYITKKIPKGTHLYNNFISPKYLNEILKINNLEIIDIKGIKYNPLTNLSKISNNPNNNYIAHIKKTND